MSSPYCYAVQSCSCYGLSGELNGVTIQSDSSNILSATVSTALFTAFTDGGKLLRDVKSQQIAIQGTIINPYGPIFTGDQLVITVPLWSQINDGGMRAATSFIANMVIYYPTTQAVAIGDVMISERSFNMVFQKGGLTSTVPLEFSISMTVMW